MCFYLQMLILLIPWYTNLKFLLLLAKDVEQVELSFTVVS